MASSDSRAVSEDKDTSPTGEPVAAATIPPFDLSDEQRQALLQERDRLSALVPDIAQEMTSLQAQIHDAVDAFLAGLGVPASQPVVLDFNAVVPQELLQLLQVLMRGEYDATCVDDPLPELRALLAPDKQRCYGLDTMIEALIGVAVKVW